MGDLVDNVEPEGDSNGNFVVAVAVMLVKKIGIASPSSLAAMSGAGIGTWDLDCDQNF